MVRTYKKKRLEEAFNEEDMAKAVSAVQNNTMSLRKAAAVYGVKHTALFYRLRKQPKPEVYSSKHTFRQVFNQEQEQMLVTYVLTASKLQYGLSCKDLRILAFDYANALKRKYPASWDVNKTAGVDWLQCFMKRHANLSLRKPENTSLARVTGFNLKAVTEFQENLLRAYNKCNFGPNRIFNLDETGISTVVDAPNIIAQKGVKQVGQVTSAERGALVTMCAIVSADGNSLPPVFIFPRARYHDSFLAGAPAGSIGLVNNPPSGWMTKVLFLKVLEHIKKFTKCNLDDKILIVMDNHESHCSLDAIIFAKENGIELVTIPPHCTHRLQPLDVSIMGPFKAALKVAQHDWLISHAGKAITIHDLAGLSNIAIQTSFTPKNIISGFQKTGMWPFDRNVFSESDFIAARIPTSSNIETDGSLRHSPLTEITEPVASTSASPSANESVVLSPEVLRPLPNVSSTTKKRRQGRKPKKSLFLTHTPIKDEIEAEAIAREAKKRAKAVLAKKPKVKRTLCADTDSSSCDDTMSIHDESDDGDDYDDHHQSDSTEEDQDLPSDGFEVHDFVIVKFSTKKTIVHYAGLITDKYEDEYKIKYLRKKGNKFYFPTIEDTSMVASKDLIKKLSVPIQKGTERMSGLMEFHVDLNKYNFR